MSLILLWNNERGLVAFYYNHRQIDLIRILSKIDIHSSYRHLLDVGILY
jgi:hypothetical protein